MMCLKLVLIYIFMQHFSCRSRISQNSSQFLETMLIKSNWTDIQSIKKYKISEILGLNYVKELEKENFILLYFNCLRSLTNCCSRNATCPGNLRKKENIMAEPPSRWHY